MNVRWGDDDSSVESDLDNDYVDAGGGHVYAYPFQIGNVQVRTYGDFLNAHMNLYEDFANVIGEHAEVYWADVSQGLLNINDTEDMDGASMEMSMMMSDVNVGQIDQDRTQLVVTSAGNAEHAMIEANAHLLKSAAADLAIDIFDAPTDSIEINVPDPARRADVNMLPSKNLPPLSPLVPQSAIKELVLVPKDDSNVELHLQSDWGDTIREVLKDFPTDDFDQYSDAETLRTSRSNTRPYTRGAVLLRFEDGGTINIGSHGHVIEREVTFTWMNTDYRTSLSELFAAPGGEGLTCATPSMTLHQIISACMSHSLDSWNPVLVEQDNIDMLLSKRFSDFPFDITSSTGIWNKSLSPTESNPQFRTQSAISKYDVACAIMSTTDDEDVRKLLAGAVANCLALEYPKFFRKIEVDIPRDLMLQSNIYDSLNCLSENKIKELGAMAYKAAVELGLEDIRNTNIRQQGTAWTVKRDRMRAEVDKLTSRKGIAVPPLAIGAVTSLPSDSLSISVLGHHFQAGPYTQQKNGQGVRTHIDDCGGFREAYPACAIVPEADARSIVREILENPTPAVGLTHSGPSPNFTGTGAHFAEASDQIYSQSAMAQFAEIRADIARAVDKLPAPPKGNWQQVYLYKGKVCAWYMLRDSPTSADGFRVDWFAVSSYPVLGSIEIQSTKGDKLHLWPRQRFRSQEMKLMRAGPRRLKLSLFSMLEKSLATETSLKDVVHAWEKLATTLVTSTYASGKLYLTGRYLSTTMGNPSSPFDEMSKKLVNPKTFADIFYLEVLSQALANWTTKTQYRARCPLLGLPRAYSQLESYWMCWVPDEFADSNKNFALCVLSLHDEAKYIEETMAARCDDLESQLEILTQRTVSQVELEKSLRTTCLLDPKGMLGWTWIGSLASGHALQLRSDPGLWDRRYSRGTKSRTLADHLTVRHSARLDQKGEFKKGTVAEMMIDQGTDIFLSTVPAIYRFLFINRPTFFNHPKSGEHKEREISITDPDSRIALSDAELICGSYGVTTGVDYLKDSGKNKKFYDRSQHVLTRGGGIQSSDASRYGPNMSNFAIAIMLVLLGTASMHLKWSSVVYARLAHRRMVLSTCIMPELNKMCTHMETLSSAPETIAWMDSMPSIGTDGSDKLVWYCTSHHMGQGMSHHSSSLLHAGGICVSVDAVDLVDITISGIEVDCTTHILVTSDDSTLLNQPNPRSPDEILTRGMRQMVSRVYLMLVRVVRRTGLTMVSVLPNLVKEMISAVKGEFNSQDTGIGITSPILGFREMVTEIVHPSAPSLIGDYLNAHACARNIALAGQGLVTGGYAHAQLIDMIEERWGMLGSEKEALRQSPVIPNQLIDGANDSEIISSPASFLHPQVRAALLRMAINHNKESEDLDPHVRDTIFSPLTHIRVGMSRQHKSAISKIRHLIVELDSTGMKHQAYLLTSSLRSTISSARSRNLGRVATRIRSRKTAPKPYGETTFQLGGIMENTLNWIKQIGVRIHRQDTTPEDIALGNKLAGFVRAVDAGPAAYPLPPRLKRSFPERAAKPKFRTGTYGATPFGRHALDRSHTVVVEEITDAEREDMQAYLALQRHRKVTEHVTYGGSFVASWSTMQGYHIVAFDISGYVHIQMQENIQYGNFNRDGIDFLKKLQLANRDTPVLAIHRYDGVRGLWHAVHNGSPITVLAAVDVPDMLETGRTHFSHTLETGISVICAVQGFDDNPNFMTSEPLPAEIHSYQIGANNTPMPNIVQSLEDGCMRFSRVKAATYATAVMIEAERCLFYIAPDLHILPRDGGNEHIEFRRGTVISDLATGGYWNSNLRGVCFRAWLKGHVQNQTVWTGGTIGWRLSATSMPHYVTPTIHKTNVKDIIVGTGFDDPNQMSEFNPDFYSAGVKYVSQSNTETYARAIRVGRAYRDLIVAANFGQRFQSNNGASLFMDTMLPDIAPVQGISQPQALAGIQRLYMQNDEGNVW